MEGQVDLKEIATGITDAENALKSFYEGLKQLNETLAATNNTSALALDSITALQASLDTLTQELTVTEFTAQRYNDGLAQLEQREGNVSASITETAHMAAVLKGRLNELARSISALSDAEAIGIDTIRHLTETAKTQGRAAENKENNPIDKVVSFDKKIKDIIGMFKDANDLRKFFVKQSATGGAETTVADVLAVPAVSEVLAATAIVGGSALLGKHIYDQNEARKEAADHDPWTYDPNTATFHQDHPLGKYETIKDGKIEQATTSPFRMSFRATDIPASREFTDQKLNHLLSLHLDQKGRNPTTLLPKYINLLNNPEHNQMRQQYYNAIADKDISGILDVEHQLDRDFAAAGNNHKNTSDAPADSKHAHTHNLTHTGGDTLHLHNPANTAHLHAHSNIFPRQVPGNTSPQPANVINATTSFSINISGSGDSAPDLKKAVQSVLTSAVNDSEIH